uniref:Ig-like domain-containing protein n=1 Tax=Esox lucius TaxID=8010 RepID=A0A3P9AK55_ESOLU
MSILGIRNILIVETNTLQAGFIKDSFSFHYAHLGDSVTLQCFDPGKSPHILWYKQTAGQKPELISTIFNVGGITFHNDFKNNPRFTVPGGKGVFHLRISNIQPSDSAIYYCGGIDLYAVEFATGIFLILKGSKTVLQQPVSESVQLGDSVTLNCTINTETCEGEHSVYWFRHDSGESPPGIIYTNGDRSGQCMKSPESGSPTQSCVYNLPKRNLSLSDTGTYYCAVASCGEILFGNGTKLDVGGNYTEPVFLVYCLGVALGVSIILIIVLTYIIYKINLMTCRHLLCSSQNQDADNLHYVALNLNKNMSRRQRNNMEEETVVVYAGIRQ